MCKGWQLSPGRFSFPLHAEIHLSQQIVSWSFTGSKPIMSNSSAINADTPSGDRGLTSTSGRSLLMAPI